MNLTLIRHTSVDQPKGTCYGSSDVSVAPTFIEEAKQIQEDVSKKQFDTIYSSPLSRCVTLGARLFSDKELILDSRLQEMHFGDWERSTWDSVYQTPEGKIWFEDYIHTPCPNGESFMLVIERVQSFLNSISTTSDTNIAVITHAGVIRAFMSILNATDPKATFDTEINYGDCIELTTL